MKKLSTLTSIVCCTCACLFTTAVADTLIYNNSTLDGGYYLQMYSDLNHEFMDYGSSSGGLVSKFEIGYDTTTTNPGTLNISFWQGTTRWDRGNLIKTIALTDLDGFSYFKEFIIPEEERFVLPPGNFGYSYEFTWSMYESGPLLAYGGASNEDYFWAYVNNTWYEQQELDGRYAGFYMKVYTGPALADITCDITGNKFDDADGDGLWDAEEPGLSGWELYVDTNGNDQFDPGIDPNVMTDPNGMYYFENLDSPATHTIREVMKDGWTQTLPGGPDYEYTIVTEPNTVYSGYDFGNTTAVLGARIHGRKWHDLNDNGIIDSGEPGLSGWSIFLDENYNGQIDPNDVVTVTDSQGNYEFRGLVPDQYYYVSELDQNGWINTYPGAGGIHYRIMVEEDSNIELNFGNYQLHNCNISGYKFNDINNNGAWDSGEDPLSGWEIYIDDNENGQWDSGEPKTTTNASGYYEFTNVAPGYYNIMEVPQSGWFQTFPGPTSGRLWGIEGAASNEGGTLITELNLDTLTVEKRIAAPYPSTIIGGGCLAAGPASLFYCPLRMTGFSSADSLFFEIDTETGSVIDEGVLELPVDEIAWDCVWHNGILYVVSVVTPIPQGETPESYLNRYDPFTKDLISRDQLIDIGSDGVASDPYKDLLLMNLFIDFAIYEIDPATANVVDAIGQEVVPAAEMAYTNGVLYKVFWGSSKDDIHMLHREDGSLISSEEMIDYKGFDTITSGIGTRGGHRFWIGKEDLEANFGARLDSEASFSGIKYEDLNGNGKQDQNEPGMAGWTVYVDLDGDMHPDAGEPSVVTDSNGIWAINGLEYGRYFVREVERKDYRCTEPKQEWLNRISIKDPRDIVFDDLRNLLYVSTNAGNIERYDLSTNQFLTPVTLGGSPQGVDITADCSSLYVANTTLSGGNGVVHKIDTTTLSVTDLTYSVGPSEEGSYDIAIGSEGIALFTGSYSDSGLVPLYVLDTRTDAITVRPDVLGQTTINHETRVIRSSDRTTLWLVDNTSNGWVAVYDSVSDTFTGENDFNNDLSQAPVALNSDGSLGAVQLEEHFRIVDDGFNMVMGLEDSRKGVEFDPSSDWLYQFHNGLTFYTIDTIVWDLLDYSLSGLGDGIYEKFVRGETAMTNDGRVLGVTDPDYVVLHRSEYCSLALPGRTIEGLNFGNKPMLCGDIDGDRDVDLIDLYHLSEDWLCEEVRLDIAPEVRDYIVNMPDLARFAGAWQSDKGDPGWDAACDVSPAGGDESVDSMDLLVLAEEWLMQSMRYDSDIAGAIGPDGFVDLQDFTCLAGNWGVDENLIEYDEDFETGDFTNLPWEHAGDGPWTIDPSISFEGTYSAKSGEVPRYDESILSLTTTCGEGNILFMVKNGGGGTFRFFIDGEFLFDNDAGSWEYQDWFLVAVPVETGTHTFEWSYRPDGFGNEVAWIDAIRFPAVND